MRSLRIVIDMDCILADFFGSLWADYHSVTGEQVLTDNVTTWEMHGSVSNPTALRDCYHAEGFFRKLEPLPGAVKAINTLIEAGHEVYICTAPCTPHSAAEKIEWAQQHLPGIPFAHIFTGSSKHLLRADVFIDDAPHHATKFKQENPDALVVGISYPYNGPESFENGVSSYDFLAPDFKDTEAAWTAILDVITRHAH